MPLFGKRKIKRYDLNVPVKLSVLGDAGISENNAPVPMETKNISSAGAFLITDRALQTGTRVNIGLTLSFDINGGEPKKESYVQVRGEVVRVDARGMAVRFAKQYRITAI